MIQRKRRQVTKKAPSRQWSWQLFLNGLKAGVVLALLGVTLYGGWRGYAWLSDPTTLPLRVVQIKGELLRTDASSLQRLVKAEISGGFFNLNIQRIKARLEQLPWVYRASLRRVWPDQLDLYIEEQRPIAYWGDDALLNQYGEVFTADLRGLSLGLPYLYGEEAQRPKMIETFVSADRILHPLGLNLISLKMDRREEVRLLLDNGIELALGRRAQLQRLERFASVYDNTLRTFIERIAVLDLRYSNGFALQWKDGVQRVALGSEGRG